MTRLHLLGFTPDLKGLVFSGRRGGKKGTYWVPVDKALREAVEQIDEAREERKAKAKKPKSSGQKLAVTDTQDLPLPRSQAESRLSPREVQRLLREGRSVRDVAKRAGVSEEWVERFMGPVVEEQAGVIQMTRSAYQDRARLGRSALPIGDAVRRNLDQRKATADTLNQLDDGWSARRMRSQIWRVRLSFKHRGKRRSAEWEFRKDGRAVRPRNQLARELGWWPSPSSRAKKKTANGRKATKRKPAKRKTATRKTGTGRKSSTKRKAAKRRTRKR